MIFRNSHNKPRFLLEKKVKSKPFLAEQERLDM